MVRLQRRVVGEGYGGRQSKGWAAREQKKSRNKSVN